MKKLLCIIGLVLVLVYVLCVSSSFAEGRKFYIKHEAFGFVTKDLENQFIDLITDGDEQAALNFALRGVIEGWATFFNKGDLIYIQKMEMFSGLMKVRHAGESQGFWTVIEAIG